MAGAPETRYAELDGVHFAYQVLEANGPDLLLVPCPNLPIDLLWDDPTVAGHLNRLASFSRLILTDLLGIGSSDSSPPGDAPMQSWTDGFIAVLDAREAHAQRVRSLILAGAYAFFLRQEDQNVRYARVDLGIRIRVGLHTGEIEMAANDIHGIAVHVAARIMGLAGPDEVLVSGAMPPLVLGSRIAFDDRGAHELKGVPDMWPIFAVR